mmetsp:Transcript_10202/g.42346  ORF Transcript_10202/g.42346 Transcript_10202/m.42346 type:complete len:251 (+) Transcript_10202:1704-2456(+)
MRSAICSTVSGSAGGGAAVFFSVLRRRGLGASPLGAARLREGLAVPSAPAALAPAGALVPDLPLAFAVVGFAASLAAAGLAGLALALSPFLSPATALSPLALASTLALALGSVPSAFFLKVEFQWFLMALSVLPGSILAISAHLLPWILWASSRVLSSSSVHPSRLISGLRWLCHRSRHCLPMRPGRSLAIIDHFLAPCSPTRRMIAASSSGVHGPLTRSGLSTFCHLCRHCTSVRSGKNSAIFFQFLPW